MVCLFSGVFFIVTVTFIGIFNYPYIILKTCSKFNAHSLVHLNIVRGNIITIKRLTLIMRSVFHQNRKWIARDYNPLCLFPMEKRNATDIQGQGQYIWE